MEITLQKIAATETHELRQRILRPHQPIEEMVYPLDRLTDSYHAGAFLDGKLKGIVSLYPESQDGTTHKGDWRLRGMAVDRELQGRGIGKDLVRIALDHARSQFGKNVWCNARTSAMGFYLGLGFESLGEEFDIPGIGPHLIAIHPL